MVKRIVKYLCAKEVQIMLTRMEERPEDFVGVNTYTTWRRLMEHKDHYTWIERKVIGMAKRKMTKTYERKRLLARILEETVTPTKHDETESFYGNSMTQTNQKRQALIFQQQALTEHVRMQNELARQMTNAAASNIVSPYQQQIQYENPYR